MLKEIYRNKIYYIILFAGLIIGLIAYFSLVDYRVETVVGLCLFYYLWGIGHHLIEKDLHIKIILEYFLVSGIACLILLSLLWRA